LFPIVIIIIIVFIETSDPATRAVTHPTKRGFAAG
jgi:hypothetical protein